jgi:DNA-binding NarL/FixJ family response regulator
MESPDSALRVVLADDHHFFREGLRGMLAADGMAVVGEATDGAGAVTLARELAPDVVVIDLKMPNASGVDALRQIATASPDAQLVVVTVSADEVDVLEALAAGACGYLLKDTRADELVGAIRLAAGGHAVLSRDVLRALVARVRADSQTAEQARSEAPALTARELEVIRLIADGADNVAIGRELSISRHTVKQYVTNIFEKLGVQSRVQAAVYAVRQGLV